MPDSQPQTVPDCAETDLDLWHIELNEYQLLDDGPHDISDSEGHGARPFEICMQRLYAEISLCAEIARDLDQAIGSSPEMTKHFSATHLAALQQLDLLCQLLEGAQIYSQGLCDICSDRAGDLRQPIEDGQTVLRLLLGAQRSRIAQNG